MFKRGTEVPDLQVRIFNAGNIHKLFNVLIEKLLSFPKANKNECCDMLP